MNLTIQYSENGTNTAIHNGVIFELELSKGHHWITLSKLGSINSVIPSEENTNCVTGHEESQNSVPIRSVDQITLNSFLTIKSVF